MSPGGHWSLAGGPSERAQLAAILTRPTRSARKPPPLTAAAPPPSHRGAGRMTVKLETAPRDRRVPTQNQAKACYMCAHSAAPPSLPRPRHAPLRLRTHAVSAPLYAAASPHSRRLSRLLPAPLLLSPSPRRLHPARREAARRHRHSRRPCHPPPPVAVRYYNSWHQCKCPLLERTAWCGGRLFTRRPLRAGTTSPRTSRSASAEPLALPRPEA